MNLKKNLELLQNLTIFVAYNTDVDAICRVDKTFERLFSKKDYKQALKREPESIQDKVDLLSGILLSMKENSAEELPIYNEKLQKWISENTIPKERRMGGQAGIMSNLLSTLGCKTIIYTKLLSKKQANMFRANENLFYPLPDDNLKLKHPKESCNSKKTKVNWVFEFDKNDKLFSTKAQGDNRFIAASRPEEINLEIGKLENYTDKIAKKCDCAILSGYHDLKKEYKDGTSYIDHLKSAERFIKKLKEANPNLNIQVEFASTPHKAMRKEIVNRILPPADVLSMDRSETSSVLELLEGRKIDNISNVVDYYKCLEKILEKIEIKCVKIHTLHYFMAIFQDYLKPEYVKNGLEFARRLASVRAKKGEIISKNDLDLKIGKISGAGIKSKEALADFLNSRTLKERNIYEANDHNLVFMENKLVRAPKLTVGLGDVISAGSFALENALNKVNR